MRHPARALTRTHREERIARDRRSLCEASIDYLKSLTPRVLTGVSVETSEVHHIYSR